MNLDSAQQQYDEAETLRAKAMVAHLEALDLFDVAYRDAWKAYEASHPGAHLDRIRLALKLKRADGDDPLGQAWQAVRRAKVALIYADERHQIARNAWWSASKHA